MSKLGGRLSHRILHRNLITEDEIGNGQSKSELYTESVVHPFD